jgi:N-acetylmuramoyl-L-alanine amidase
MRRLLPLLVLAALGAWLVSPALSQHPYVPDAVEFAQAVPAVAGASGWRSPVLHTSERFDLVGLTWQRTRLEVGARIRVRDAADGTWSPWTAMAGDHAGGAGAEPVWAGGADALQVRLAHAPRGLRAQFVNTTGSATLAQRALTALRGGAHDAYTALAGAPARAQGAGPQIISRAEWGASACGQPRFGATYGTVQAAFVHHTVNANDYGPQDSAAIVRAICRYHRNTKGWRDVGYNFLVDRYGQIFEGREGGIDQAVIGAQAQGYNSVSTGVANIGTFSGVAQTPDAVNAMAELLAWKLTLHGTPVEGQVTVLSRGGDSNRYPAGTPVTFERISGHRDADATTCPGNALYAQLPELRRRAADIAPDLPDPATAPPGVGVTLTTPDATLDYPQPAQLAGQVRSAAGAPLAGATVSIQVGAGSRFVTLSRVLTRADGTWSVELATQYTRTLRAAVRLPDGALATSRPLTVAVAPRIGIVAPKRVVAARTFTVRGSIRPQRSGVTLAIARQGTDGEFHTVARAPVRATGGTFRAKVRLRRPAIHRLRIESRSDARNRAGRSRDVILRAVRPRR